MIPKYIEECYPAAVDGTDLEDTKLKIEILPGNALCHKCNKVFNILENNKVCPTCSGNHWEMISGREFMIKEIVAYQIEVKIDLYQFKGQDTIKYPALLYVKIRGINYYE